MKNSRGGSVSSLVRRYGNKKRDSSNTDPSRGCEGKERFLTFTQAERVARLARRRKNASRQVYRCRHCQGFHFGSALKRKRRSYMIDINTGDET